MKDKIFGVLVMIIFFGLFIYFYILEDMTILGSLFAAFTIYMLLFSLLIFIGLGFSKDTMDHERRQIQYYILLPVFFVIMLFIVSEFEIISKDVIEIIIVVAMILWALVIPIILYLLKGDENLGGGDNDYFADGV